MKKMIVTAGGTVAPIDEVRGITNGGTGALGCDIAQRFSEAGAQVYFVHNGQFIPKGDNIQVLPVKTVAELEETLTRLLKEMAIDVVVHTMAVSDFVVAGYTEVVSLEADKVVMDEALRPAGTKLSSKAPVGLVLAPAPKIIGKIKALSPQTALVGFKLLSHVAEAHLVQVGYELLKKNGCDYVVVNDLAHMSKTQHHALILNDEGAIIHRLTTKAAIGQAVVGLYM